MVDRSDVAMEATNLARLEGNRLYVPAAVEGFGPLALVDGVTAPSEWEPGSGWQVEFTGALLRNRVFDPSDHDAAEEPVEWMGLRRNFRGGKEYSCLGWVILEMSRPRVVTGIVLHSVDTAEFPASKFGVRDVLVECWDAATDRWMRAIPVGGPDSRWNTVEEATAPRIAVPFQPVRTDLVRVAIRWTNASTRTRSLTVMGRREEYASGTIRLTELEVLGPAEPDDVVAVAASERVPETPSDLEHQSAEQRRADESLAATTVSAYMRAYEEHDIVALAATLDASFQSGEDDRTAFLERTEETFRAFPYFLFRYEPPAIERVTADEASAVVNYSLRLSPLVPRTATGSLVFRLARTGDQWKIAGLSTEAR
ncbi:hypothetical protein FJZ36_08630 [Candidatus Poribacteria bacterium]|nr:hypothetical protein [Candidatus Poribacteria bacterium]